MANCEECLKTEMLSKNLKYEQKKTLAVFLCYDCENYVCSLCYIIKHTDHLTFSLKDKSNEIKLDTFCTDMMEQLTSGEDQTLDKFTQERTHICDIVDVEGENNSEASIIDICILHAKKQWAIADLNNKCIKIFNINNNKMTKTVYLTHRPHGLTEIPSTDHSSSLIAVSLLYRKQIYIMDIISEPARAVSSINIPGQCRDLAFCNNKLITRCEDYLEGEWRHSIPVMDMSGHVMYTIDLHKLPDTKLNRFFSRMYVNSNSETICLCHYKGPSCVISLSIDGKVLHYIMLTDLSPCCICVDRDQTVYVMDDDFPLYKLSSDLSQKEKVIDEGLVDAFVSHAYHFKSIACHADTFYLARSDGKVVIIRHE